MAQKLSWQVTVTTAGTAVAASALSTPGGDFIIKADPDNTGSMFIGNDGADDVASTTGFELDPGDQVVMKLSSLSKLMVDSSADGEKVHILLMEAYSESDHVVSS